MKKVIDLSGKQIEVEDSIAVKTVNGLHYLHTPGDEAEIAVQEANFAAQAPERKQAKIIAARNKERGSWGEQIEYFIDNGYDALKLRDDQIKLKHPKL